MADLKKLVIEDFQSHRRSELEFSPGLTVIVGESDHGKSAIMRALKWVLFNEPRGADFIRAGALECKVSLELDDGTVITRERSTVSAKNKYILEKPGSDTKIFEGFGTEVPEEIVQATGVKKVFLDESTHLDVNISDQLDPPFLLSSSGAVRAKAVGKLSGIHIVDAALRRTVRELSKLEADAKSTQAKIDQVSEQLQDYNDLPLLEQTLNRIASMLERAQQLYRKIAELELLKSRLVDITHQLSKVEEQIQTIRPVAKAEETLPHLETRYRSLTRLEDLKLSLSETRKSLTLSDQIIRNTEGVFQAAADETQASHVLGKLKQLELIGREKRTIEAQLSQANKRLDSMAKLDDAIQLFTKAVTLTDLIKTVQPLGTGLKTIKSHLTQIASDQQLAEEELQKLTRQYVELLRKVGKCPTCLTPISKETIENIISQMQRR